MACQTREINPEQRNRRSKLMKSAEKDTVVEYTAGCWERYKEHHLNFDKHQQELLYSVQFAYTLWGKKETEM
jgi:hypothetical protein